MCGLVYIKNSEQEELIEASSPEDLLDLGLELIDIDQQYLDACWCCSDPLPTLFNVGYLIQEDASFSDFYARKPICFPILDREEQNKFMPEIKKQDYFKES